MNMLLTFFTSAGKILIQSISGLIILWLLLYFLIKGYDYFLDMQIGGFGMVPFVGLLIPFTILMYGIIEIAGLNGFTRWALYLVSTLLLLGIPMYLNASFSEWWFHAFTLFVMIVVGFVLNDYLVRSYRNFFNKRKFG